MRAARVKLMPLGACLPDQPCVPIVQRAHRRHEADRTTGTSLRDPGPQAGDRLDDLQRHTAYRLGTPEILESVCG